MAGIKSGHCMVGSWDRSTLIEPAARAFKKCCGKRPSQIVGSCFTLVEECHQEYFSDRRVNYYLSSNISVNMLIKFEIESIQEDGVSL